MLRLKKWTAFQRWLAGCSLLYSVIFIAMLIMRPGSKQFYSAFFNTYQIIPPLFAGVCGIFHAWRGTHPSLSRRLGWLFIGIAGFSFSLGQSTWTYFESIRGIEVPFPSLADAGYLGAYPLLLIGVLCLFSSTHVAGRARMLLDSLIAVSGLGSLSWYFIVQNIWQKSDVSLLGKLISVSYPLGDIAILCGALTLFTSASRNRALRRSAGVLSVGMVLVAFFDTSFTYYSLNDAYHTGMWFDWTMQFGWIFIAYASLLNLWAPSTAQGLEEELIPVPQGRLRNFVRIIAPYTFAFSALAAVAVHDYRPDHVLSLTTSVMGFSLISLIVARQVFTLLENRHLTENLEVLVTRRTEQLKSLHDLTKSINNTLQVDQVLQTASTHTKQAMRADAVAIWLFDRDTEGMTTPKLYLHQGLEQHPEAFRFIYELPANDRVETLFLSDEEQRGNAPAGAFLRVPLRWQQKPMGMIGVVRWGTHFTHTDAEMLESIGIEIGTALENARLYGAAVEAADCDPVTGLFNHRAIHQRLDKVLKSAKSHPQPLALIMMDLGNFKLFNDTYGHPVGDQILKRVGQVLLEECEENAILARYGGDEFLAVLPEKEIQQATVIAERVGERMLREGYHPAGEERIIPIVLNFGIAVFPEDGENRHELLTNADANLYIAKNSDEGIIHTSESRRANRSLRTEHSFSVLEAMITAVDNKDRYTRSHSEDVTDYALWIAEEMGMSEETMRVIRIGGLLHDVGKISIPDEILRKPDRLTPEEYEIMKRHPRMGALIVGAIPGMEMIVDVVRSHHERWDGQGYPDGTAGEETPLLGRIVAVADAVSAMTTNRPYRKGLSWDIVEQEIRKNYGTQFDPKVAQAFLCAAEKRGLFDMKSQLAALPKAA